MDGQSYCLAQWTKRRRSGTTHWKSWVVGEDGDDWTGAHYYNPVDAWRFSECVSRHLILAAL